MAAPAYSAPKLELLFPGGGSDDEEDFAPLPSMNSTSESAAKQMQESFMLSQSGTFKTQDFALNSKGLAAMKPAAPDSPDGEAYVPPGDVHGMDELETLAELGSGASGVVFKAKHKPTGEIVAVKQVNILEKPKREQIVSELKILRTHQCPWVVALYNAFYEETKVRERESRARSPSLTSRVSPRLLAPQTFFYSRLVTP